MSKPIAYNWESVGPGGCDNHNIEHPCGLCIAPQSRPKPIGPTPRPWFVRKCDGHPNILEVARADGTAFDEVFHVNRPDEVANAHLIAAAPEMLEALKLVLTWNDDLDDKVQRIRSGLDQREVVQRGETLAAKIAAVLDKAEGRS